MFGNLSETRIVQVITEPTGGGAEMIVREMHKGLLARGIDSRVIFLANQKGVKVDEGEEALPLGQLRSPLTVFELRRAFVALKTTVPRLIVHSHLTWPLYITPWAAAGMNIPLCYTEHSTTNRRRSIELLRYVEPAIYRRYSRVFCVSAAVKDSLQEWLGGRKATIRTEVIENGSRLLEYKGDRAVSKRMRLVSVGSLNRRKGFEWSLRAVATLRDIVESYTIVGEGPDRAYFEAIIRELGIGDIVRLVGWSDDLVPYYHAADVLLVPSLWEGFGLVCVEGMSTGLPVIASDVPGMRDLIKDSGAATLVPAANPSALAVAVREVHRALLSGAAYSKSARQAAELHGTDKMVSKYIAAYSEIASEWFGA